MTTAIHFADIIILFVLQVINNVIFLPLLSSAVKFQEDRAGGPVQ